MILMNNLTLCIGGRNQIAVDAVDYILSNYKIDNLLKCLVGKIGIHFYNLNISQ